MLDIPLRFLLESSSATLGDFELAKLNQAANLRKQLRATFDRIVEEMAAAAFARWMIEHREELLTSIPLNLGEHPLDLGGDSNGEFSS